MQCCCALNPVNQVFRHCCDTITGPAGEPAELLRTWRSAEAEMSKEEFKAFRMEWNRTFVAKVCIHSVCPMHGTPEIRPVAVNVD